MKQAEELAAFVQASLARGVPRAEIESVLMQAGWSTRQVRDALAGFAEASFPIPVPRPRPYTDAREAFLYGLLFVALYVSAFHFGLLIFAFIERAFPQQGSDVAFREMARSATSILVVALPLFLFLSRLTSREVRQDPSKRVSEIRTKLTYLTLFVSAAVLIGVLAGLVYSLLGGELTVRFVLKCLTAAAIAAAVFGYYLRDVRVEERELPARA